MTSRLQLAPSVTRARITNHLFVNHSPAEGVPPGNAGHKRCRKLCDEDKRTIRRLNQGPCHVFHHRRRHSNFAK